MPRRMQKELAALLHVMRDCHRQMRRILLQWRDAPPPQAKRRLDAVMNRLGRALSVPPDAEPPDERPAKGPDPSQP